MGKNPGKNCVLQRGRAALRETLMPRLPLAGRYHRASHPPSTGRMVP